MFGPQVKKNEPKVRCIPKKDLILELNKNVVSLTLSFTQKRVVFSISGQMSSDKIYCEEHEYAQRFCNKNI